MDSGFSSIYFMHTLYPIFRAAVLFLPLASWAAPIPVWPEATPSLVKYDESVKKSFLAWRKEMALAELKTAGVSVPAEFLAWVDSQPLVYQTIYGFDNPRPHRMPAPPKGQSVDHTDRPAQRLACLLSLEIDLGPEITRKRNLQLALALTHAYAGRLDDKTFECPEENLSWKPRPRFKLVIPQAPHKPVDTRAKDRSLDREDHIINFLEDHPQPVDPKNPQAGTRPLYGCEVLVSDDYRAKFVAYMKSHGHTIDPRHVTQSSHGLNIFLKAYTEKGRIPKAQDPFPKPAEVFAYLVRNDQFRFLPNVKRSWPRFNLESPWPVLEYLAMGDMPLRDREFVWKRFVETGSVRKYGHHLGAKLGLNTPVVRARRIQPFDFAYGSYAMDIKDHGACREMTRIGLGANAPLGIPAAHSFQPGHFCLTVVTHSPKTGYHLSVEQHVKHPTWITKGGVRREDELARLTYPLNYGFEEMLDAHTGLALMRHLPANASKDQKLTLLKSMFLINPYAVEIPRMMFPIFDDPSRIADFWVQLNQVCAAVKKTGCPTAGPYTDFTVRRMLDGRLHTLPVPENPAVRKKVMDLCLRDSGDDLWLKYAGYQKSPEQLLTWSVEALRSSVHSPRTEAQATLMAARLGTIGKTIKDEKIRRTWGQSLLTILRGKETFAVGEGRARREVADPSVLVAQGFAGQTPDARLALERDLRQAVSGGRSPARAQLLSQRVNAIARGIRDRKERAAWGETLHAILLGKELYVTPQAPDQPQFDPTVREVYHLGINLTPARQRFVRDFSVYLKRERSLAMARAMDQRLSHLLAVGAADPMSQETFLLALEPLAKGKETFSEPSSDPKKPGKTHKDPCIDRLMKSLPKKTTQR
ncbi:MAG: hypothetical protein RL117_88 [Verrucomicrobiota bacterium]|jgi:hypothetical protein